MAGANDYLVIGRIVDVYGLKGWVKVKSFTQPIVNILLYKHYFFQSEKNNVILTVEQGKVHGKGLVMKFVGFDDRTAAETLLKLELKVEINELPVLESGEFYWHQLENLDVFAVVGNDEILLGRVDHLLETGSNDVLMIKPCEGSVDKRERLLPYRPEVLLEVDLVHSKIRVDWDIEF